MAVSRSQTTKTSLKTENVPAVIQTGCLSIHLCSSVLVQTDIIERANRVVTHADTLPTRCCIPSSFGRICTQRLWVGIAQSV